MSKATSIFRDARPIAAGVMGALGGKILSYRGKVLKHMPYRGKPPMRQNRSGSRKVRKPKRNKRKSNDEQGTAMRAAKVINRRKKSVSFKKKPKVSVSKKFKLKVAKALEPKESHGRYLEIGYQNFDFEPLLYGNKQKVERIGINSGGGYQQMFSPAMVLNAASVLFNGKAATESTQYTIAAGAYNFGANSFDPRTTKLNVRNSYCSFVLRNNTPRTWIIQLYEVSPKLNMNVDDEGDAYTQWINCMVNESSTGTTTNPFAINIASATPNTLYATPLQNKMIQQKWNWERHEITLDPGQSYDHFIQGPSNVVYDYAKFWKQDGAGAADKFYDYVKKFTRQLIIVARLDLVQDNTVSQAVGRQGNPLDKGRLLVEWKNYYNITCPEVAGGVGVVGGGTASVTNQNRKDCYFHKNWYADTDAAGLRVADETQINNLV